jgi:hypothetical protein
MGTTNQANGKFEQLPGKQHFVVLGSYKMKVG